MRVMHLCFIDLKNTQLCYSKKKANGGEVRLLRSLLCDTIQNSRDV